MSNVEDRKILRYMQAAKFIMVQMLAKVWAKVSVIRVCYSALHNTCGK